MQLRDALFNWLQIQIVWEARPLDRSAEDTVSFFEKVMEEDYEVSGIRKEWIVDEHLYQVSFVQQEEERMEVFPADEAQKLLTDILSEPKYNQAF